jgi:hypothetical protein
MVKGTAGKKKEKVAKEYTFKVAHWCKNSYAFRRCRFLVAFLPSSLRAATSNATSEAKTDFFFFFFSSSKKIIFFSLSRLSPLSLTGLFAFASQNGNC